jgi:Cdc6-like AAA superfamily ATPase
MKIREVKQISTSKLRSICIKNNWYTCGTVTDYSNMFTMCEVENVTTETLYQIAKDIYEHTNVKSAKNGCSEEYSDIDNILNMMIYVNDATYVFYEVEE